VIGLKVRSKVCKDKRSNRLTLLIDVIWFQTRLIDVNASSSAKAPLSMNVIELKLRFKVCKEESPSKVPLSINEI
jgi:hypothetical protein